MAYDFRVHRISYFLSYGFSQADLLTLHHCDNRRCVRPDHLYAGDQRDNILDIFTRKRRKKGYELVSGENNANSKITFEQAVEIREIYQKAKVNHTRRPRRQLAERYGVSTSTIQRIAFGKSFKGVSRETLTSIPRKERNSLTIPNVKPSLSERFWSKVEKTDSCWFWRGTITGKSPVFASKRKNIPAQRIAYELGTGKNIPVLSRLYRKCKNEICVNPEHLRLVITGPDLATRFWSKVLKTETCWIWKGYKTKFGHGMISTSSSSSFPKYAHRVAWSLTNGEIPKGKIICHKCDNASCVNPDHLYLGNFSDNMYDVWNRNRRLSSTLRCQ